MGITSAGIFGYLSNAFQQQNIKLDQVQREINVWDNKIKLTNDQIVTLQLQQKDLSSTQNSLITKGNVNSRLIRSADNRDKQSTKISNKINSLQDSLVSYNGKINDIKNNNIEIEREVGGFRFVAEAFNVELKTVVKFFIILIVIVFDPLAIALVIAFNQLMMTKRKDEDEIPSKPEELKDFVDETTRLHLSENDLKVLEEALLKSKEPNEKLKEAAQRYSDEVREKHTHIDDFEETSVKSELTPEERGEILAEMMKNDQELGLYDEPFDNPMIKEETSDWDVTLMDGLEDEEPFFTEEEIEKIFQEEPTEEEIQENFSTIEPNTENIFQEEDFDGFVPEPFATPEEVKEYNIDVEIINETLDKTNEEIDSKVNVSSSEEDEKKKY
jgi:septal ring factor EnvC (AmiA/AmiB activator)